jgi:hypothetical protein
MKKPVTITGSNLNILQVVVRKGGNFYWLDTMQIVGTNKNPAEGELLGIANALHKSRYLTIGTMNLIILTDHMPLVNFLDYEYMKENENRRLLNLKTKIDNYIFRIQYVKGSSNMADGISRIPKWSTDKLLDIQSRDRGSLAER